MAPYIMMGIHLIAVIAWMGGMFFTLFVIRPAFGGQQTGSLNQQLLIRIHNRFRAVRWLSIIAILLTGFFNLLYEGGSERLESEWGAILMVKILIVFIAMGMTGVIDFILYPALAREKQYSATHYDWLNHIVLFLIMVVVFIAIYLSMS